MMMAPCMRKPAPGVEQIVQGPGDRGVGEDRPDELLQDAGEARDDHADAQRPAKAIAQHDEQRPNAAEDRPQADKIGDPQHGRLLVEGQHVEQRHIEGHEDEAQLD
jgi:hypothetical protein